MSYLIITKVMNQRPKSQEKQLSFLLSLPLFWGILFNPSPGLTLPFNKLQAVCILGFAFGGLKFNGSFFFANFLSFIERSLMILLSVSHSLGRPYSFTISYKNPMASLEISASHWTFVWHI